MKGSTALWVAFIVLAGIILFARVSPFESLSVTGSISPTGFAHQFSVNKVVRASAKCTDVGGCPLPVAEGVLVKSGDVKISYKSLASGSAMCLELNRDSSGQVVEIDHPCPKNVIITTSYGHRIELKPGETARIGALWNITYTPQFLYETIGVIDTGASLIRGANEALPDADVGQRTYIAGAVHTFLIGFDVDKAIKISVPKDANLVVPFKGDGRQEFVVSALDPLARGLAVGFVGQDSSDVYFRGTKPVEFAALPLDDARRYSIKVPTDELGLRKLDAFGMVSFDVGDGSSLEQTIRLATINGIRAYYDVLPVGANTAQSRARVLQIRVDPGSNQVVGLAPVGSATDLARQDSLLPESLVADGPSFFDSVKDTEPSVVLVVIGVLGLIGYVLLRR